MTSPGQRTCSIGIDLGTTGIKVVAFETGSPSGEQIALASQPSELHRSADGAAELDLRAQLAAINTALADAVRQAHASGYRVACIGISAAMHSLLAVGPDSAPLTPLMTWADLRAQADAERLWASPEGQAIYSNTGTPIHAMSPLAKLLWLRRCHADTFQQAARFVGLKEWLWHEWFGEWKVDVSVASAMGLYNLRQRRWDGDALRVADIEASRLSEVVPCTYTHRGALPDAFRAAGVDDGCVVVIGSSDGVCANLGVHGADGRQLALTVGTSLAVRVGSSRIVTDPKTRIFCYALDEERSLYIVGAPSNSGGAILQWMYAHSSSQPQSTASQQPTAATLADAMAAAGAQPAPDGLFCLPYLEGERAPLWSTQTTGALIGLRATHTPSDLLRAAAEGILLNARWIAEPLLSAPTPPQVIIASGGGLQSAWMRQLAADIFGVPVAELATVEASARGAALFAELAIGASDWSAINQPLSVTATATPDPARHQLYSARSQTFKHLAQLLEGARA